MNASEVSTKPGNAISGKVALGDAQVRSELPFGAAKIQAIHWERLAIVYVRQSSPQQVLEHRESAALQYDLARRAAAWGWPQERVLVIDEDQGQSAKWAEGRQGFQRLLAEVSLDHVGLVLGIEMSRLARSCKDWHQLLEVCALFRTLLADQDGLYDPTNYNDRLLLGLKGTMSEAELHILQGRMNQGRRNKARRGELLNHPVTGYIRVPGDRLALDPDGQVQTVVRLLFDKFEELGTVNRLLQYLVRHGIRLGIRPHYGPNRGNLEWRRPCRETLLNILHHPCYAGAYTHGRRPSDPRRKIPGRPGTGRRVASWEKCEVLIRDHHPAYIAWERASYQSDRAARQYHAVEPENRLVVRQLEHLWEEALRKQRELKESYDRFLREQPPELTAAEGELVRSLASDIPALWNASTTTAADRQMLLRHLIERVVVAVQGDSELVDVSVEWVGGYASQHQLVRPVARYEQLHHYRELLARAVQLRDEGRTTFQIAEQLNREGWRPPKRRPTFNGPMVCALLSRSGSRVRRSLTKDAKAVLGRHEWWFQDLAGQLDMPHPTLYSWLRRGWVHARQLPGVQGRWVLWADEEELDRLHRLRTCPHTWSDQPLFQELTVPKRRNKSQ